jgi:hypothetical protein
METEEADLEPLLAVFIRHRAVGSIKVESWEIMNEPQSADNQRCATRSGTPCLSERA